LPTTSQRRKDKYRKKYEPSPEKKKEEPSPKKKKDKGKI
jgi:hypothetical protein